MFVGITTNALGGLGDITVPGDTVIERRVHRVAVSTDYSTSLVRAGLRPVHLSPLADIEMLDGLGGLLLAGGFDVDPTHYDQERHALTGPGDYLVDAAEINLVQAAIASDLPVLAICRGFQLLSVALGGTLHQHVPEHFEGVDHCPPVYERMLNHPVRITAGTRLHGIYDVERLQVNSSHHQGLDRLGDGLRVSAHADDGLIEGVELPEHPFAVGVQWHPEAVFDLGQRALFEAFEIACRAHGGR